MKQFIAKYFSNHTETNENHPEPGLKTRYYKANKDQVFRSVQNLFDKPSEIVDISKERGELSVNYKEGKKAFVVATIIMVRPYRTAVDFSVSTETGLPVDFGNSRKLVRSFYQRLDQELPVVDQP
ncbi:cytosolic protein [Salimicrobium sp. PL1-032A]|uniref:cytosolic protein n=1 Tax=Salimicrobium sp. PL1-032A TaxID=3095364 RepID=UPI0032612F03